jgi:hypothetical protein
MWRGRWLVGIVLFLDHHHRPGAVAETGKIQFRCDRG